MRNKLWLFLVLSLSIAACSSKKPVAEDGMGDSAAMESGADEVGSVPEDMLGNEVGAPSGGDSEDPFADLKSSDGGAQAAAPSTDVAEETVAASGDSGSGGSPSTTYTVRTGDTLMKIAYKLYGDLDRWKEIHEWNRAKLANANKLEKGMVLSVEPETNGHAPGLPNSYKIKKGDTLAGIADEVYGKASKWRKLQKFNAKLIKNPNRIFAGFTLWYDITPKEIAEAEQRRSTKMAGGGSAAMPSPSSEKPVKSRDVAAGGSVPSAINPPAASVAQPSVAVAPADAPVIVDGAPAQPTAPKQ